MLETFFGSQQSDWRLVVRREVRLYKPVSSELRILKYVSG